MKQEKKILAVPMRLAALALAIVLAAVLVPSLSTQASAATYASLKNIEKIKATRKNYTILEIVPQAGTGSIGYYVGGCEPTANWMAETAQKVGSSARKAYADGIFTSLQTSGLMGTAVGKIDADGNGEADYPLNYTGAYKEYLPWEPVPDATATTALQLKNADGTARTETVSATGTMNPASDTAPGSFSLGSTPSMVDNGGYVQNVLYFTTGKPADGDTSTYFYYKPTFEAVTIDEANPTAYIGMAVYTLDATTNLYHYEGTIGVDGYTATTGVTYYKTTNTNAPGTAEDADHPYRAISSSASPFKSGTDGDTGESYFKLDNTQFTYVGEGLGEYAFTPGTPGSAYTLAYSAVYVDDASGYTNNNWFLKYVFDMSDTDITSTGIQVKVFSVLPTAAGLGNLITTADMIVVSAGFSRTGNAVTAYGTGNDITSEQKTAIQTKATDKTAPLPVLVDSAVEAAENTQIAGLSQALRCAGHDAPLVSGSVYCFKADADRKALATANFTKIFDASQSSESGDPYYDVLAGIKYENFLRKNAGTTDPTKLLPETVSMGSCIRHIINYAGRYKTTPLTTMNVLDVEPLTQLTTASQKLTEATVRKWLPEDNVVTTINITTMSTAEFISKIEDINEVYDLVYIGASTDNFTMSGGQTSYTDTAMNGLFYSNIGDKVTQTSTYKFTGLLDTDYYNSTTLGNYTTVRYSGNDITDAKAAELSNFAKSGYPIVIADELASGREGTDSRTLSVTAGIDTDGIVTTTYGRGYTGYQVPLTAAASVSAGTVPSGLTYNWFYKEDGSESYSSITVSNGYYSTSSYPSGEYYCTVSDGTNTATSETLRLSESYINISASNYSSRTGTVTLTVDSPITGLLAENYRWYQYNSYWHGYNWYEYVGEGASITATASTNALYFCRIVSNNRSFYSQQVNYSVKGNSQSGKLNGVNMTGYSILYDPEFYNDDYYSYYEDTTTYTGWGVKRIKGATPTTLPGYDAVPYTVRADRVDDCSVMYSALTNILSRANVMSESKAEANSDTLLQYLNLSKPKITLTASPAEYDGTGELVNSSGVVQTGSKVYQSLSEDGSRTLSYTFTVSNETDPTPLTTTYTCKLFIDQNGDGRYSDDADNSEEVTDLTVTENNNEVDPAQLAAGHTYTVTRMLPSSYSGLIPWRLEVRENGEGNEYIHTSKTGYTYVNPNPAKLDNGATKINVLQVTSYSGTDTSKRFSLADSSNYYKYLFDALRNMKLYDITITPVPITSFSDALSVYNSVNGTSATSLSALKASDISAAYAKYLKQYNMLILGFGDGYGCMENGNGLGMYAAEAVVDYIATGQAVLFTHDTTSLSNVSTNVTGKNMSASIFTYSNGQRLFSGDWYWGYYFNDVIRDAVGLDRYGVTSPSFGLTQYMASDLRSSLLDQANANNKSIVYTGKVSGGQSISDSTLLGAIKAANYSVAYVPDNTVTTAKKTVPNTQGYTTVAIKGGGNHETTTVSQVNKGQITSYPFDINLGTDGRLPVATTHYQYYQLNMNSDDVVVWYCLAGDYYEGGYKNDGVNAYYIYNKGNITYSGAGHSPYAVTGSEAKLFVNTMIAAFRAAVVNPTMEFKDAGGDTQQAQFLPVEFGQATASAESTALGSARAYFSLSDPNLASSKNVSVQFYYQVGNAALTVGQTTALKSSGTIPESFSGNSFSATVYSAKTGKAVTSYSSGGLYYITIPPNVIAAIAGDGNSSATLLGVV
ncbi:MAG: DUF5057 domain-containing protein [Oscillospiraceae bacterium]|nr:DUF5057 domain-containing protein [Oscillospiraceae bacterium]